MRGTSRARGAARRPTLQGRPDFMLEDEVAIRCWNLLCERLPAFQHSLVDEEADEVVAEVSSVPVQVGLDDLPDRDATTSSSVVVLRSIRRLR
ncbi:MAG TPA: hypothetical protein VK926_00845 [Gaiellaceae bacterium]|nr:hypothetical protein [Gaiellaceae bacterium]